MLVYHTFFYQTVCSNKKKSIKEKFGILFTTSKCNILFGVFSMWCGLFLPQIDELALTLLATEIHFLFKTNL